MIINSLLPSIENFVLEKKTDQGYLYLDRESDRFGVSIPDPSLWDLTLKIHIGERKGKSNASVYLQRVIFKVIEASKSKTHSLIREEYKSWMAHSYRSAFSYAVPIGDLIWLSYNVEEL